MQVSAENEDRGPTNKCRNWAARSIRVRGDSLMTPLKGCALSLFLALVAGGFLLFVFVLALQGEVRIGKSDSSAFRIWLVRETVNQGVGISTTRKASSTPKDAAGFCQKTTVRFLLWRSDGDIQNISYCECYAELGGFLGACPISDE